MLLFVVRLVRLHKGQGIAVVFAVSVTAAVAARSVVIGRLRVLEEYATALS